MVRHTGRTTVPASSLPLETRLMLPEDHADLTRFFYASGYPVRVEPTIAWGVWRGSELAACVALCLEEGTWVLRGPEVLVDARHRGIGKRLLAAAAPELAHRTTYCIAYSHLRRMYSTVGFRTCRPNEAPDALRSRVKTLRAVDWDVILLIRTE
jgi:GNAT superfamily N-acetyltransferase